MNTAVGPPVPNTCFEIIMDAMVDAGKLGEGDEPNSEQLTTNMRRLNKLIMYLCTQGIKLFIQEDLPLTLTVGKGLYTMGPGGDINIAKPRRVIEAYYVDNNQARRPLILMSRQEWDTLSTTTNQGTTTSVYPDKQLNFININLWLVPDATAVTGTVHLITDMQVGNFVQVTDTMAFPPEWALALEWGLANQLSTGQPQAVIDRCEKWATFYQSELEDWDVEDASTSFQMDTRFYVQRRFK